MISSSKILLFTWWVVLLYTAVSCAIRTYVPGKENHLADNVQIMPMENVLCDSAWNIWCGSMVEGYDGKYHLFYSRWPRHTRHEGWISHSEIAYAVPFPKVVSHTIHWSDGTTYDVQSRAIERPFIYFNKRGEPELLFGAFGINRNGIRREHSFNGWIPFKVR